MSLFHRQGALMSFRLLWLSLFAGFLVAGPLPSLRGQTLDSVEWAPREAQGIEHAMSRLVDMKDFRRPMKLKDALCQVMEQMAAKGIELPILVDSEAFREDHGNADVYDVTVRFLPRPAQMTVARFLEAALAQVGPDATFLVRRNYVEVTTSRRAWLEPPNFFLSFFGGLLSRSRLKENSPSDGIAIRGGLIDTDAGIAYLTRPGGGLDAVALDTGKVLWSNTTVSRPLALEGKRLLALSHESIANSLRLIVLDRSHKGKLVLQSDPLVFPSWVSVEDRWGRRCETFRWRLHQGDWFLHWRASAWGDRKPRLPLEPVEGVAQVSLKTGRVKALAADGFPAPETVPWPKQASKKGWFVPPRLLGDRWAVLSEKEMDGQHSIVLTSWDPVSGKPGAAVELIQGRASQAEWTMDERHVAVVLAEKDRLKAGAAEWIFDVQLARPAFKLKQHHSNAWLRLVAGKRIYGLKVTFGRVRISERRLVQPLDLHVMDLQTGRALWTRPLAPVFTGLYPLNRDAWCTGPEVVPSLLRSLKTADPGSRRSAAEDLGNVRPPPLAAFSALAKALRDPDDLVRLHAAEAVLRIDPKMPTARTVIRDLLKNPEGDLRARAAETLGLLGELSKPAVASLCATLSTDRDALVRGMAATALGRIRAEPAAAVPALAEAIKDPDMGVRFRAAGALIRFGRHTRSVLPTLRHGLKSQEPFVREMALHCVHWLDNAGVAALCEAMQDKTLPNRALYAETLTDIVLKDVRSASKSSFPTVLPFLWDSDRAVRFYAAWALKLADPKRGVDPAVEVFYRLLVEANWDAGFPYQYSVILMLEGPRASKAVPLLCPALKMKSLQEVTVTALGEIGPAAQPSVPLLKDALNDEDKQVRIRAALALWRITGQAQSAATPLVKLLDDKDGTISLAAAKALWHMGRHKQKSLGVTIGALKNPNTDRRRAAMEQLAEMGPEAKASLPVLATILKNDNTSLRVCAAYAICQIGAAHAEAVAVLTRAMDDESPEVCLQAARYLGNLGDRAKAAWPALLRALDHEDVEVYLAAISSLNAIDWKAAVKAGVGLELLPRKPLTRPKVAPLWKDLTGDDLYKAYFAQWRLTETPAEAVPWFEEFFPHVKPVSPERLARWVDDLKSEKFRIRQEAHRKLSEAGELAEPVLRRSLAASTSLEFSRRVQKLLDDLQPTSPRRLRLVRTVQVLEYHHTPEAEKLLLKLAGGIPESWQTQEARHALERIKKR
jgi:HEAT repeat protein